MEVSQLPNLCPAGPKCIQLRRSKVITVIHEDVRAVDSPGIETRETVVPQRGAALANTGVVLSEPTLARPPAQPVRVPAVPPPCEDIPLRCSGDSLGQRLHPQPRLLTSDGKFIPILPLAPTSFGPKRDKCECRSTSGHQSGTRPRLLPSPDAQADIANPSVTRESTQSQYPAFHWQEKEAEGCRVCLHHLAIHHKVILLPWCTPTENKGDEKP